MITYTDWNHRIWRARVIEPKKRNKDGMRWIIHRFPIKGGITIREAILEDLKRAPPMLKLIEGGKDATSDS